MVEFRYNALRLQLGLPDVPTAANIQSITRFTEAALKDMPAHGKGTQAQVNDTSTPGKDDSKSGMKGSDKPADSGRVFDTEKGCPRGCTCEWEHPRLNIALISKSRPRPIKERRGKPRRAMARVR